MLYKLQLEIYHCRPTWRQLSLEMLLLVLYPLSYGKQEKIQFNLNIGL